MADVQTDNQTSHLDRHKIVSDLEEKGVVVVDNVLSIEQCDRYISQYKAWAKQFEDAGIWFFNFESLIQDYRIGHIEPSWDIRLKVKDVFAKIWNTEKLLTSIDAVALSPPPEEGSKLFRKADQHWLHLDQGSQRLGLHAYQGAVYLEETTERDHCFRVLLNSHKHHTEFYETFQVASKITQHEEFYQLDNIEKEWYEERGCQLTSIPVKKGGMVLWDSRTVHDNVKPDLERPDPKWRHAVFICMTPALWASERDLAKKRQAYDKLLMTTHWPSQNVSFFPEFKKLNVGVMKDMEFIEKLPDVAVSTEAKSLMGVVPYDFEDGLPNGPDKPQWA